MAQHGYYNIGAAVSFKPSLLGKKKGILFSENKRPKVDLLLAWISVPISESRPIQWPMSIASVMWAESLIRCFRSVYPYQLGKVLDSQLKEFILWLVSGHGYRSPYYFCLSRYRRNRYSDIYPSSTQTRWLFYAVWTPLSLRHHWSPPEYCSGSLRRRGNRERSYSQIDSGRYSKQHRLVDSIFILSVFGLDDNCVCQVFLSSPVSTFNQKPIEENRNLFLVCCWMYFACLAVYGDRRVAYLSAYWSRSR